MATPCRPAIHPQTSTQAQLEAYAARERLQSAFIEPAWFVRLREVSLSIVLPRAWAGSLGADQLSLAVAGRNLMRLDDYGGLDPETNSAGQASFDTLGPRRLPSQPVLDRQAGSDVLMSNRPQIVIGQRKGSSLRRGRRRSATWPVPLVLLVFGITGCEDILDARLPNVIPTERFEGEAGAAALYAGALGQFAEVWSGGGSLPGRVLISGILADEYQSTANLGQFVDLDRREAQSDQYLVNLEYELLHRARHSLEDAARRMHSLLVRPETDPRIGEMWALSGWVYVALAEDYCDGITISHFPDSGDPVFGVPLTQREVLRLSLARFDSADTWTAGVADVASLVEPGAGPRPLLGLGEFDAAAAAAANVATGFTNRERARRRHPELVEQRLLHDPGVPAVVRRRQRRGQWPLLSHGGRPPRTGGYRAFSRERVQPG